MFLAQPGGPILPAVSGRSARDAFSVLAVHSHTVCAPGSVCWPQGLLSPPARAYGPSRSKQLRRRFTLLLSSFFLARL